jgi:hypothetical protein
MRVILKHARLSFTRYLWNPSVDEKSGNKRYNCHLIVTPGSPDHKTLTAAVIKAAEEGWPGEGAKKLAAIKEQGNVCLKNGSIKSDYEGYEGNFFVSVSSKQKPDLRGKDKEKVTEEDGKMYAGCYVWAELEVKAIKHEKGNFISAYLRGMMVVQDSNSLELTNKLKDEDLPDIADTGDELGIGEGAKTSVEDDMEALLNG